MNARAKSLFIAFGLAILVMIAGCPLPSGGDVYLTFDDGPSDGNTPLLIAALKDNGCDAATFFIIGQNIATNPTGWTACINSGFSLQNHSMTHSHMGGWSYQEIYNDLNACQSAITGGGAPAPRYIRLPYLETSTNIQAACSALGLQIVTPTVDTQDWNGATAQAIAAACSGLQAGGNPLLHDFSANTITAVPGIVQYLGSRGFTFVQY